MVSLRWKVVATLALVVPVSLALKFYPGPGRWWLNNWGASIGYEVFFVLVVFLIRPRPRAITAVAVGVCLATCALEFLQLWNPGPLAAVRSTFPGRMVLGNSFSWVDFPAYPAGCFAGWLTLRHLTSQVRPASNSP